MEVIDTAVLGNPICQVQFPLPFAVFGNESVVDSVIAKIYQLITRKLFQPLTTVIAPSAWLLREHSKRGFFKGAELLAQPNPAKLPESEQAPYKRSAAFKILYVGQVERHKGFPFLLESFNKLCASSEGTPELIIVGGGSALRESRQIAASTNRDKIRFLGRVDNKYAIDLMRGVDCLVVPSLCYENSPTVLYEAITRGLPAVASRIGGITEFIHNFGGLLFEPGNTDDFIRKMNWAIKNPSKLVKIGESGIKKIYKLNIGNYIKMLLRADA